MKPISEDLRYNAPSPEIINIMDEEFYLTGSDANGHPDADDAYPGPSTNERRLVEDVSDEYIIILYDSIRYAQTHREDHDQASEDPEHGISMALHVNENSEGNSTDLQQSLATETNPYCENINPDQSTSDRTPNENISDEELHECIQYSHTHHADNQDSGDSFTNGHLSPETGRNLNSEDINERIPTNNLCEVRNAHSPHEEEDQSAENQMHASSIINDIPGHSRANIDETDNLTIEKLQEGTNEGRKRKHESEEMNGEPFKRQCREIIQAESSSTVSSPSHSSVGEDTFTNLQ
ncbi:uncharacterized protein LOC125036503 [Penaeus chinensis]|uniref:uncharacterized protein LOC125036503 n=1 Tax=Penaeus chinensis TaxID=139456 RepID=UPI001FB81098|nr:uncharacterized protein LOC125036503 [Penaeus chinensis]